MEKDARESQIRALQVQLKELKKTQAAIARKVKEQHMKMLQSESNCNTLIKLIKLRRDKPDQSARGDDL